MEEKRVEIPVRPNELTELKVNEKTVDNLILKFLYRDGRLSSDEVAKNIKIAPKIIQEQIKILKDLKLIHTQIAMKWELTSEGKTAALDALAEDGYIGPCPVCVDDYNNMVLSMSKYERKVKFDEVRDAFGKYEIADDALIRYKEAFNSQKPILFYGPPGNGKTLVTKTIHSLLKHKVIIPFAFEFNGKAVKVFDPTYHRVIEPEKKPSLTESGTFILKDKADERWFEIEPPFVIVGTEFRVRDFEISYRNGCYEAPPQIKANNGIFVIDDLGRQQDSHIDILNAFIYPLESEESIITMHGGSRLIVPYKQRLFLSTNLRKTDIIDDAFNRRLLYQFLVDRPSDKVFKEIMKNTFRKFIKDDSEESKLVDLSERVVSWYNEENRLLRACDPRNLAIMYEATFDEPVFCIDIERIREVFKRMPKPLDNTNDYT